MHAMPMAGRQSYPAGATSLAGLLVTPLPLSVPTLTSVPLSVPTLTTRVRARVTRGHGWLALSKKG